MVFIGRITRQMRSERNTGLLVPIAQTADGTGTSVEPDRFAADFAERVSTLLADPTLVGQVGETGRERAGNRFSWPQIARETHERYRTLPAG